MKTDNKKLSLNLLYPDPEDKTKWKNYLNYIRLKQITTKKQPGDALSSGDVLYLGVGDTGGVDGCGGARSHQLTQLLRQEQADRTAAPLASLNR